MIRLARLRRRRACPDPRCGWSHRGREVLEQAWGIIANASDWDVTGREEWRRAAEHFRDYSYPGTRR